MLGNEEITLSLEAAEKLRDLMQWEEITELDLIIRFIIEKHQPSFFVSEIGTVIPGGD